jgi:hypothetical protein
LFEAQNEIYLQSRLTLSFMTGTASLKKNRFADPDGCAVQGVVLRSFAFWDCGFESLRRHGPLSLVSVVFCQERGLLRADHSSRAILPTVECLSDREASTVRKLWSTRGYRSVVSG